MSATKNILIIGTVLPEPTSSAAGSRMLQLINVFIQANYTVTFCSTATSTEFSFNLSSIGVQTFQVMLNHASFDDFLKQQNPSIVVFDRFMIEEQFGWRVAEHCPNALRILDTEDLHLLRYARQNAYKEGRTITPTDFFSDIAKREIASILRCDISLLISEVEMEIVNETYQIPKSHSYYLPFLIDADEIANKAKSPAYDQRQNFIFIGNYLHAPNWETVNYLKKEIWPLIRQQNNQLQLTIYGAYSSEKVMQLNNKAEGFNVLGRTENVENVMRNARVCLAPLPFGAGIKGKFIDAMLCGTPIITTTVGAESMQAENKWCGFIADTPETIAKAALNLYEDESMWNNAQANCQFILNKRYKKENYDTAFITRIETVLGNLDAHRLLNFTGAMLLHHTLNSTKYLAKYIEFKNK